MKNNLLIILAVLSLISWQCSPETSTTPAIPNGLGIPSTINYDESSRQLMKELAPQIVGTWALRQVSINYQKNTYFHEQAKMSKDTTIQNLATLTIVPAAKPRTSPIDTRRGEYDGTIQYAGKSYPVQFDMLANAEWLVNKKGPQTFFLFDFRFPDGMRIPEPEDTYLKNIGLVGDNYSLETTVGQPKMIWRGLNRGVERIELVKQ
jgi:hypothetical protein